MSDEHLINGIGDSKKRLLSYETFNGPAPSNRAGTIALRVANFLAFVLVVVFNALGGLAAFGIGTQTGRVSDKYPVWITPGLIYISQAAFVIYSLLPGTYTPIPRSTTTSIYNGSFDLINNGVSYFYLIASAANITWIFVWSFEYVRVAAVLIFLVGLPLWSIVVWRFHRYIRELPTPEEVRNGPTASARSPGGSSGEVQAPAGDEEGGRRGSANTVNKNAGKPYQSLASILLNYWVIRFQFSIYGAWLLAASTVNTFIGFRPIDLSDPSDTIPGSIAALVIVGIVGVIMQMWRQDAAVGGVITWALVAISRGGPATFIRSGQLEGVETEAAIVATTARIVAGIVGAASGLSVCYNVWWVLRRSGKRKV
ncbi:hypothetical protein HK102_001978 [Quaeritorhiza haematococci]|nr:hypothetical protein HK102_001978 [Quaeritorhiza haematococci]